MDFNELWKTIGIVIINFGGAGAIVAFVSKLIAENISQRVLNRYNQSLEKDIEKYKHDLLIETEKYKNERERLTYVTKIQFDTEFEAYKGIFNHLFEFANCTVELYPRLESVPVDETERKEYFHKKFNDYCKSYNEYSQILEINAPFIPEEHYNRFVELRKLAHSIGCMYPEVKINDSSAFLADNNSLRKQAQEETNEFVQKINEIKCLVRDYLSTLKVN